MRDREVRDEEPLSPDLLLRRAAAGDASRASELLAYVPATKLLDAVVMQAELAVDEDRARPAGIDAIAELDRAAIEVMDLPQGADLDLDVTAYEALAAEDELAELGSEPELGETPVLIGWELVTVPPSELMAATLTVPVRPWHLALVAFADEQRGPMELHRVVAAASADGRVVATTLRFRGLDDAELLEATVSRDPGDLGELGPLAADLRAALEGAARGD